MKSLKSLSQICKKYLEKENLLDRVQDDTIVLLLPNEILDLINENRDLVSLSPKEFKILTSDYGEFAGMDMDEVKFSLLTDTIHQVLANEEFNTISKVKKMRLERSK